MPTAVPKFFEREESATIECLMRKTRTIPLTFLARNLSLHNREPDSERSQRSL